MTLSRLPDGSVRFDQIDEWQLQSLKSIPAAADPRDEDGPLRRLFPAPFSSGEATPEQQEDWAELVQPELEALFSGSLATVAADLRTAEQIPEPPAPEPEPPAAAPPAADPEPGPEGAPVRPRRPRRRAAKSAPPGPRWRLNVPADHVEDWFRAMNQARLMMSERFEAHRTDGQHIARMLAAGKFEMVIFYELLTGLCGWWVDQVLHRQE